MTTRKFNGKVYKIALASQVFEKSKAEKEATKFRKQGYLARIVKQTDKRFNGLYAVYVH